MQILLFSYIDLRKALNYNLKYKNQKMDGVI